MSPLSFALLAALAALTLALGSQTPAPRTAPSQPVAAAAALPMDRGAAALRADLRKLNTRASLLTVVAHPDDEDGGMLAYESRGQGVETSLLTLNRGEGGQNLMSADYWDQLGILRTQELLAAGRYYGVHQYFTRVADFGFSKTIDETLKLWGHDRVLYDCVRVVRLTRPLVVTSTFAGNVSDGHGQHQVSGLMAQEVYTAAGDPMVFPDQIRAGLRPWSPLKVYARVPFARVTEKGIYDYATGHWEPVRFRNYVTKTWIEGIPSTTLEVPEGDYDPLYGRSYLSIAREGLGQQKSQNGGVGEPPRGPFGSPYHLYASRAAGETAALPAKEDGFFEGIDISLAGIAAYAPVNERAAWQQRLEALQRSVDAATAAFDARRPEKTAPALAEGLAQTRALLEAVKASALPADAAYNMQHELGIKEAQFNQALLDALALSVQATVVGTGSPGREAATDLSASETTVAGQRLRVGVHVADQGALPVQLVQTELVPLAGGTWTGASPAEGASTNAGELGAGTGRDLQFEATTPADQPYTEPYFSRPTLEQAYYDLRAPQFLNLPNMPYPLAVQATFRFGNVDLRAMAVVQTVHREVGAGPVAEPLRVAPPISVTVSPGAGVLPLDRKQFEVEVTVHSSVKGPAQGSVRLDLPPGWTAEPASAPFATEKDNESRIVSFRVVPRAVEQKVYSISAVAEYGGAQFRQGFERVGYPGLRPYPYFRPSVYRTTGTDVKVAPGLRVGYVMGTGDEVARSLEDLGVHATLISPSELAGGDLSTYDAIVLGIRAYAARPELGTLNGRLLEYARRGGVVLVQYQTQEFDRNYGPYPLALSGDPEKVVEEDSKVSLLAPGDPLLNWPNHITTADFDGWVEERGHGFLRSWDPHYIALTETQDAGQDPQRGGLVYTRYGRGAYIYLAFAFFRQMPEGVPGSFRIMANLISLAKNPAMAEVSGSSKVPKAP